MNIIQLHPICESSLSDDFISERTRLKSKQLVVESDHAFLIDNSRTPHNSYIHTMDLSFLGQKIATFNDTFLNCVLYAANVLYNSTRKSVIAIDDDEILCYRRNCSEPDLDKCIIPRVFVTVDDLSITDGCKRLSSGKNLNLINSHYFRTNEQFNVNEDLVVYHLQSLRDLSYSKRMNRSCRLSRRDIPICDDIIKRIDV